MRCAPRSAATARSLTGRKMWITNGPDADVLVVYMRRPTRRPGSRGITAFIVETRHEGLPTAQKLDKLGMRGSNTCELVFEDCVVPDENVLGQVNGGVRVLMRGSTMSAPCSPAGRSGIMPAALDLVLPYVHERKQFGQPIGTFELMQAKVADMYAALKASRAFATASRRPRRRAAGAPRARTRPRALLFWLRERRCRCLEAIQALGGNGYINEIRRGAAAARREALHDRRRHEGDPPHADRARPHRPRSMSASRPEVWRPDAAQIERPNVTRLMRAHDIERFEDLVARSIGDTGVVLGCRRCATSISSSRRPTTGSWIWQRAGVGDVVRRRAHERRRQCVDRWAERTPDVPCGRLGRRGRRRPLGNYADLREQTDAVARAGPLGVGNGDTVAIYLPMAIETVAAVMACAAIL